MAKFFLPKILTSTLQGKDLEDYKKFFHQSVQKIREEMYSNTTPLVYFRVQQENHGGWATGFVVEANKDFLIVATCLHTIEDEMGKIYQSIRCERITKKSLAKPLEVLGFSGSTVVTNTRILAMAAAEDGTDLAFIKLDRTAALDQVRPLSCGYVPSKPRLCFMTRQNKTEVIELFSGALDPNFFSYIDKFNSHPDRKMTHVLVNADKKLTSNEFNGIRHLVVRSNGEQGCSGGPVFDHEWNIYGMVVAKDPIEHTMFILPIKRIVKYLDQIRGELR